MTIRRRFLSRLGFALLGAALALSSVAPAQASGGTFVVGNPATCRGAVYPDIQSAVTAAMALPTWSSALSTKTIRVCAGTYVAGATLSGGAKVKLIAKNGAVIIVPGGFTGQVITVQNSSDVTVQGFTIEGGSNLASTGTNAAISFNNSSGSINHNTIQGWRESNLMAASNVNDYAIYVSGGGLVKITNNTLNDFQANGIYVTGSAALPSITGNKLFASGHSTANTYGIDLYGAGPGKMTGNKLAGDLTPGTQFANNVGLVLDHTSSFRVSGNTVSNWVWGAAIIGICSFGVANNNTVRGNRFLEVATGVYLLSASGPTCDGHADSNIITGNTVKNAVLTNGNAFLLDVENYGNNVYALDEVIKGNRVVNFTSVIGQYTVGTVLITGIFGPNSHSP